MNSNNIEQYPFGKTLNDFKEKIASDTGYDSWQRLVELADIAKVPAYGELEKAAELYAEYKVEFLKNLIKVLNDTTENNVKQLEKELKTERKEKEKEIFDRRLEKFLLEDSLLFSFANGIKADEVKIPLDEVVKLIQTFTEDARRLLLLQIHSQNKLIKKLQFELDQNFKVKYLAVDNAYKNAKINAMVDEYRSFLFDAWEGGFECAKNNGDRDNNPFIKIRD